MSRREGTEWTRDKRMGRVPGASGRSWPFTAVTPVSTGVFFSILKAQGGKGLPSAPCIFSSLYCSTHTYKNSWGSWLFAANSEVNSRWELWVKERWSFLWNVCASCQSAFFWQASLWLNWYLSIQMYSKPTWQPFYAIHVIALYTRGDLGTFGILSEQSLLCISVESILPGTLIDWIQKWALNFCERGGGAPEGGSWEGVKFR